MIPTAYELTKPFLEVISDGKEHEIREVLDKIAYRLGITEENRNLARSNGAKIFDSRVYWVKMHLLFAGLIETPKVRYAQITNEGKMVLKENPPRLDKEYLMKFEKYKESLTRRKRSRNKSEEIKKQLKTPEDEIFEKAEELNY